jgi:hypothetical protein
MRLPDGTRVRRIDERGKEEFGTISHNPEVLAYTRRAFSVEGSVTVILDVSLSTGGMRTHTFQDDASVLQWWTVVVPDAALEVEEGL